MTKYLNFSEDFTEKIKKGKKKATLRLGLKDYHEGEVVIIRAGNEELGQAKIIAVRLKKFSEITDEDAKIDGFENKEELKKELERFYGEFPPDTLFTQIIFELI